MLFCAIIIIIAPVFLSSLTGKITATDWTYRHEVWIERYLKGDFTPIFEYPPLFHFLMIFLTLGLEIPVIWFQLIFTILSLSGILYMVNKLEKEKTVLFAAILLASSIAYVEFSSALMPQALDYFLFPLAVVFYFKDRVKSAISIILFDFLMHGTGFIFLGILFIHSLLTKREKFSKVFFILLIILLPIFYYYHFIANYNVYYIWDADAQGKADAQYYDPVWKFFALSGFMTWVLLPYASYKFYKKRFKLTEIQLLCVIWIVLFFPFVIFEMGYWRMISYQIVPLSLLAASILSEENERVL